MRYILIMIILTSNSSPTSEKLKFYDNDRCELAELIIEQAFQKSNVDGQLITSCVKT